MRAELAAAAIVIAACVVGVRYWESRETTAISASPRVALAAPRPTPRTSTDEVRIPAAADSQFYVTAAVNDAPASFLVDTGAAYVALRDTDARKAGLYTNWTDFTQTVRTANGETKAAVVEIAALEIGALRLERVKALILPDDQLSVNLLGMSFLSRLESVEARSGELILRG